MPKLEPIHLDVEQEHNSDYSERLILGGEGYEK